MAVTIKLHRSDTTGITPSSLSHGELAVNTKDNILWVGNASNVPVPILQTIFVQASNSTPVGAIQGAIWIQTDKQLVFMRYNNQWYSVTGFDLVSGKLEMAKDLRIKHDGTTFLETKTDVLGDGSNQPGVLVEALVSESGILSRGEVDIEGQLNCDGPTFLSGTTKINAGSKLTNSANGSFTSWTNPAHGSGRMYSAYNPPTGSGYANGDIWFELDPT
jgi:hypothetical protein